MTFLWLLNQERYKNIAFSILNESKGTYSLTRSGTSITMDREVLSWIDERVKERIFASRSHAFEYAIRFLMKHRKQTLEY